MPLHWRHNDHDGVSNHQPHGCLLNRLFRRSSKKTSKLRVTGFCAGNSPVTGEFPAQRASYAENVSIWRRHHGKPMKHYFVYAPIAVTPILAGANGVAAGSSLVVRTGYTYIIILSILVIYSFMCLLPDMQTCRLRMRRERLPCNRGLAIPTCITARAWRTCRDA